MSALPTLWLRVLTVVCLGGGGGAVLFCLARGRAQALQAFRASYAGQLSRDLAFLRLPTSPRQILVAQGTGLVATVLAALLGFWLCASVLVVLVFAPRPWLLGQRARRVNAIEEQLDGWLQGLASSLRATPSLGEAIEFSMSLVNAPLREELDTLIKEQRLGTPLDDALSRMGARIASNSVQSALGALRIARNTGGDLSHILERSAATLREMARLEGVVRTKTAEGKAQAYVVAVLPFPMIGLFSYLNPSLLAPLLESFRGYCVTAGAFALWLSAIVVARKILDVDL